VTYERINPEDLGAPRGWTNGMLAPAGGRLLFVAGQDASEVGGGMSTDDFVEQFAIALEKSVTVVREAGGGPQDIGRLTIFVTSMDAYLGSRAELGENYRAHMGKHYPAMALVEVLRLVEPGALVEIEATAVIAELGG
jgi:enamine deaminase RidA (YjgF/YER057c/UK114 family)